MCEKLAKEWICFCVLLQRFPPRASAAEDSLQQAIVSFLEAHQDLQEPCKFKLQILFINGVIYLPVDPADIKEALRVLDNKIGNVCDNDIQWMQRLLSPGNTALHYGFISIASQNSNVEIACQAHLNWLLELTNCKTILG
jgi:hypothetical protein